MAKKCISKATGKELSCYESEKEAKASAKFSKKEYKLDLYPYQCENCGKWHLAPKASKVSVKQNACSCTDIPKEKKTAAKKNSD